MNRVSLAKELGVIYTKPLIVEFILDLVEYTPDRNLPNYRLLDPSFGDGAFLEIAVKRLLDSYIHNNGKISEVVINLSECIRGIEINLERFTKGRSRLYKLLEKYGISSYDVDTLLNQWLIQADFLLWPRTKDKIEFDFVVGNPPYVRQELIPDSLLKKYRKMYTTIYDRSDLYVPFIQHSLELLNKDGVLGIICSDRFTKNKYGQKLRKYINDNYSLKYIVDIQKANPFEEKVSAYPGIFIISATEEKHQVKAVSFDKITPDNCEEAKEFFKDSKVNSVSPNIRTYSFPEWFKDHSPWLIQSQDCLKILKKLEDKYLPIESDIHGIKVGIGVATGADKVYIIDPQTIDIEQEVLVPLVMTRDLGNGKINWSGKHVINPFKQNGGLIYLKDFPKLSSYFSTHQDIIRSRNIAQKNPDKWYKTIDRIYPDLILKPKLLIPDIKGTNLIVKDNGNFYPHHNLYYILPGNWNIDVLQSILLSSITKFFIWSYATKMRGDYLRYQAQYIRKIRLPGPKTLSIKQLTLLTDKKIVSEPNLLDQVVAEIYELTYQELMIIRDTVI